MSGYAPPEKRGLSAYYRHCVSARVFNELDWHVWKLAWKWANWTHPHKGKRWIVSRYFGAFNPARRDRWVFGDRDSGAYLLKFAWTKITRHTLVKGWASPDDPALTGYWAARRRRGSPRWIPPGCGCSSHRDVHPRGPRPAPGEEGPENDKTDKQEVDHNDSVGGHAVPHLTTLDAISTGSMPGWPASRRNPGH